jgi:hypothetical protein
VGAAAGRVSAGRILELIEGPRVTGHIVAQQAVHDFYGFAEPGHAFCWGWEFQAEGGVLGLVPAGAQANVEPAIRDVVERDSLLGQKRRVPEGIAADQHAQANSLRNRGERGQQGPGFEIWSRGTAGLHEVVAVPGTVETQAVEQLPALDKRRPGQVLVGDDSEAHAELDGTMGVAHCVSGAQPGTNRIVLAETLTIAYQQGAPDDRRRGGPRSDHGQVSARGPGH